MEKGLLVKSNLTTDNFSGAENWVDSWLAYNQNNTPATIQTYEKVLKIYFNWARGNGVVDFSFQSVSIFLNSLERDSEKTGTKIAPRTRRLYRATLCVFIKFLAMNGVIRDFTKMLPSVKGVADDDGHERKSLTKKQAQQLLKFATDKASSGKIEDVRNAAIIGILLSCGLRAIEISRLKMENYNGTELQVSGKGGHGGKKPVKVPKQAQKLLNAYLKIRRGSCDANSPLFYNLSKRGGKARLQNKDIAGIQSQTVSYIVKKMLVATGIISDVTQDITIKTATGSKTISRKIDSDYYKISAHSLRHFTACEMIRQNVSVEWVRQVLRHSNAAITSIYFKDVDKEKNNGTEKVADSLFDD